MSSPGPVVLTTGGLKHRRGQRPRRPTPGCNKCPIRRREFGEKKCRSHSDQQKKGFPQRVYPPGKGQTPQRNFTMTTKWLKGKWALRENLPNRRLRPEEYSPPGKTRVPPPPPTPDGSLPAKIRNEALRRGNYNFEALVQKTNEALQRRLFHHHSLGGPIYRVNTERCETTQLVTVVRMNERPND